MDSTKMYKVKILDKIIDSQDLLSVIKDTLKEKNTNMAERYTLEEAAFELWKLGLDDSTTIYKDSHPFEAIGRRVCVEANRLTKEYVKAHFDNLKREE